MDLTSPTCTKFRDLRISPDIRDSGSDVHEVEDASEVSSDTTERARTELIASWTVRLR